MVNRKRMSAVEDRCLFRDPQKYPGRYNSQNMCRDRHEAQSHHIRSDPGQIQRYRIETACFPHAPPAIFIETKA